MEVALIGAVLALILASQAPAPTPQPAAQVAPAPAALAPAPPPVIQELVVVLPDADGRVGTVIVERGAERIVLNEPYASTRITADSELSIERLPEPEVRASFHEVVTALPERPMWFRLYFVRGSDTLTDASRDELGRMLAEVSRRNGPDIVVVGHTDRVGKEPSNDALSLQRAERVRSDLVGHGIAAERIRVAGRGEREPVIPTEDGVDEPRNRRVEITVR